MTIGASLGARLSPRTFLGRMARMPLHLVPRRAVLPVLAGINRGRWWVAGSYIAGCWLGTYEADYQAALRQVIAPGSIVYDVGANVGFFTLAFSTLVGSSGHVYAFEPDARNVRLLRRHLALNKICNVTVVQAAVADRFGLVGFEANRIERPRSSAARYIVPTISLDGFSAAGHPAPDFVKMDVEGAECDALAGAKTIFATSKPSLMLATHSPSLRARCAEMLTRDGYRLVQTDLITDAEYVADFFALPPRQIRMVGNGNATAFEDA